MDPQPKHCPSCGSKIVEYRHTISKGMARALVLLREKGGSARLSELGLNNNQHANFQKLQYWQLVKRVEGKWQLQPMGHLFLRGTSLKRVAVTFRGKTVKMEGPEISIDKLLPWYSSPEEYADNAKPHVYGDNTKLNLEN